MVFCTDTSLTSGNNFTPTERLRIDDSGNMGLNTSSNLLPNATRRTISINGNSSAAVALGVNGTREGHIYADASSMEISAVDNYMYFTAGSAERMRIDTSGRVTMPYQPSFAVTKNVSNWVVAANTIFDYNLKMHDVGNNFDTSTHKFTCPVSGVYQFNWYSIFYSSSLVAAAVYFRKNNARILGGDIHFSTEFSTTRWHNVSFSITLSCSANDTVHVINGSHQVNYHGNHWHRFSGFLIG